MTTHVAPGASASAAWPIARVSPTAANVKSAPRRVMRRISATGSLLPASIVCVAPSARACSSRAGTTSTAMIGCAATIAPPWTTFSPTPPTPKTAMDAPGYLRRVDDGADAGHHRAADERGAVEGHGGVDRGCRGLGDHRDRRVRRHVAVLIDRPAAERHPRGSLRQHALTRPALLAEVGAANHAVVAAPARGRPRQDHVVAGL